MESDFFLFICPQVQKKKKKNKKGAQGSKLSSVSQHVVHVIFFPFLFNTEMCNLFLSQSVP